MSATSTRRRFFSTHTPLGLGLGLGLGLTSIVLSPFFSPHHHCQSEGTAHTWLSPFWHNKPSSILMIPRAEQQPPAPAPSTIFNPLYYRQISTGSFLGLATGYIVAKWSRVLVLVVGATLFVVEYLELKGIHIVPYERIQRLFTRDRDGNGWDLRRAMTENIAFKIAFGASFALAATQSS